jgi:hypothetical protein
VCLYSCLSCLVCKANAPYYCSNLPSDLWVQKVWEPILFAIQCKFTVAVTMGHKNFTKRVNFRRCADKSCQSAFGAAVDWKIDRRWNYIWVTEKWNVNMASSTSRIIPFVFILSELHNLCSSIEEQYNVSTTTQKRQNSILSMFLKIHRRQGCKNSGRMVAGATIFHTAGA